MGIAWPNLRGNCPRPALNDACIRRATRYWIGDEPIVTLRVIMTVAMVINMFLLGCEPFTEFYYPTQHSPAAQYLYFGLHGHAGVVPWIWTAIALDVVGLGLLLSPD